MLKSLETENNWLDLLRSGGLKQARGKMQETKQAYEDGPVIAFASCCLDVLVLSAVGNSAYNDNGVIDHFWRDDELISDDKANELGLSRKEQEMFADWNDRQKLNFDQIASGVRSRRLVQEARARAIGYRGPIIYGRKILFDRLPTS